MRNQTTWRTAWEQCYDYFGTPDEDFDAEIGALRLAFYLASFGMFRASGKTRQLQLREFSRLAKVAREYADLRDRKPKYLSKKQADVEEFLARLRSEISEVGASPTDTLTTKIALATTACVPAYDRYAVLALRNRGLIGSPSPRGLAQLYKLRKRNLPEFGAKYDGNTPFMRCLDIALVTGGEKLWLRC